MACVARPREDSSTELSWKLCSLLGEEATSEAACLLHRLSGAELRALLGDLNLEEPGTPDWSGLLEPVAQPPPRCGPGDFANVCAWCGETRILPFDLRENFVCEDAGFECTRDSESDSGGEDDLCANVCTWCQQTRYLPFDLGEGFVCRDVGLDCDARVGNFEGEHEMFVNICADCGAERELPFDLSANFVCGDAGFECRTDMLHENVCVQCGQTRMCPFQLPDFVCASCGGTAPRRFEEVALPEAPSEDEPDDGLTDEQRQAKKLLDKHCKIDVNDEWQPVDDQKIAQLRGILSALHEENQSTQLLRVESEDREAQLALKATRKSVETRLAFCKEKEMMFMKKQEDLRRHVLDNQMRGSTTQAQSRRLDGEIRALEKELQEKEQQRDTEQAKIGKMAQYKNFLEHVIHESQEEFGDDIEVLMNRYATLEGGSQELTQGNDDLSMRLDRVRDECARVQTKLQLSSKSLRERFGKGILVLVCCACSSSWWRSPSVDRGAALHYSGVLAAVRDVYAIQQNEHLAISSQLHKCQVELEQHLQESQVGVISMAIEQLFSRTVNSCRLPQRKKDATDVKFAPVRGDKSDVRLEEMFKQIIERVEDLQEMHSTVQLGREKPKEEEALFDERGFMERVKFLYQRSEDDVRRRPPSVTPGFGASVSGSRTYCADLTGCCLCPKALSS
ncbi:kif1 [Symbiodinium sp. CCMP2456]|nr:kif1 [Symbiodinium sp. CCMP2456]